MEIKVKQQHAEEGEQPAPVYPQIITTSLPRFHCPLDSNGVPSAGFLNLLILIIAVSNVINHLPVTLLNWPDLHLIQVYSSI